MKTTKETTKTIGDIDDDVALASWYDVNESTIKGVCELLGNYDYDLLNNLIRFVAATCNLEPINMLSISDKTYVSQSRWLLWYSYRYMTHESYEKIAERTCIEGHTFNTRSVASGIEKMAHLIEIDFLWQKRWLILKRIIKLWRNCDMNDDKEIIVTIPNDMDVKVKVKTK